MSLWFFNFRHLLFLAVIHSYMIPLSVRAVLNNVTIDDADSLITYSKPPPQWNDQTCTGCSAIPPDLNSVYGRTWHDGRHLEGDPPLTAALTFTGTAIYVFGITINSTSHNPLVKNQQLVFALDGATVGSFDYTPNTTEYSYNVNFFAKDSLSDASHTLVMSVAGTSFVLLDYFIYTTNSSDPNTTMSNASQSTQSSSPLVTPAPTASSSSHVTLAGPIAGSILGFFFLVALLVLLILYRRRRRQKREKEMGLYDPPQPFVSKTRAPIDGTITSGTSASIPAPMSTNPPSSQHNGTHSGAGDMRALQETPPHRTAEENAPQQGAMIPRSKEPRRKRRRHDLTKRPTKPPTYSGS